MQTLQDSLTQQTWPGEWQRLRSALLTDQDGILTETRGRLARLARARGVEPQTIDDVVQETLLEAWSHLDRLHAPAGFHLWIDEICRNVCRRATHRREVDLLRRPLLPAPASDEEEIDILTQLPAPEAFDPVEELSRQDMLFLLDRALGTLPQAARQLVELCYLRELPHAEVAERLGITNGTLDTRLHRARRQLRQILSGPLREEAKALGLALDETLANGWQETSLWCPRCMHRRLQGCFMHPDAREGPNLHLRCPDCSRHYGQDTVHSMGLVSLAGLHAFRPAWKRVMQGMADSIMHMLAQGQYSCWYCGKSALIEVEDNADLPQLSALSNSVANFEPGDSYPFWIHLHCLHCGRGSETQSNFPSVDQLVYWSHPLTRQFLLQHPRWSSTPGSVVEFAGESAIPLQLTDLESNDSLTILARRQTLQPLAVW